jgi:hypothetical protein
VRDQLVPLHKLNKKKKVRNQKMIQFCKPNTPHANEQRSGVVCTPGLSLSDDRERTTDTNPETSRHGFKSARTERRERGARKEEQKPLGSFQLAQKYVRTPQHFMVTLDEHPHSDVYAYFRKSICTCFADVDIGSYIFCSRYITLAIGTRGTSNTNTSAS